MDKTKINLCDTCIFSFPECDATVEDIKFGNGKGNDNVIWCNYYKSDYKKLIERFSRMEHVE